MYYFAKNDKKVGPFSKEDIIAKIKKNTLAANDLLWTGGWSDWKKIKEIDEFKEYLKLPPPIPSNIPPPIPSKNKFDFENKINAVIYFIKKNWEKVGIAVLALIVIILLLRSCETGGSTKSHEQNISDLENQPSLIEATNFDENEKSSIINGNLIFSPLSQPLNGKVRIEVNNKSNYYSFRFDKIGVVVQERDYWFYQDKDSLNIKVNTILVKPGEIKTFTLLINSKWELRRRNPIYALSESTKVLKPTN